MIDLLMIAYYCRFRKQEKNLKKDAVLRDRIGQILLDYFRLLDTASIRNFITYPSLGFIS